MEFEETYNKDVFNFLYKICNYDQFLADDLTQETFLKAYRSIDNFKGDSSLKTWLLALAKNNFLSYIRKHSRAVMDLSILNIDDLIGTYNIERQKENEELLEKTLEIIFDLPEKMKYAILSSVFSDNRYQDIAIELGISEGSVKVLVYRARLMIRSKLREQYKYEI